MNRTNRLERLIALPASRVAAGYTRRASSTSAVKVRAATIDMLSLWRETLTAFSAHSGPVLAVTLVGFACRGAIAQSLSSLAGQGAVSYTWPLALCGMLGLLLDALARGALAWIGLQDPCAGTQGLLRVTLSHWRGLLAGSVVRTILTFACALGGTALFVVSGLGLITPQLGALDRGSMTRIVAARAIDSVLLEPEQPLSELVMPARDGLLWLIDQPNSPAPDELRSLALRLSTWSMPLSGYPLEPWALLPYGLVALISLAFLFVTEGLLHLYAVAAMGAEQPPRLAKYGALSPLVESARLGLRYFWPVTASTWTLRLAVSAIQITCLVLPIVTVENVVLPWLTGFITTPWVGLVWRLACCVGGAAVSAILAAFCALYDARLFAALQRAERDE